MSKVKKELFVDALTTAYCEAAPKKLADQIITIREEQRTANKQLTKKS